MTTDTTQGHIYSSKSEINLIILQVNINRIKNKLEKLKLLIHDTHADIITIQEPRLSPKVNTLKINFTTVRADRLDKAGGRFIILIRDNITFTTTDILSTINTHNTELLMVMVHINNTKHITTFIFLLETIHPSTTKQLTPAYSTSQRYHTQSSPVM